MITVTFLQKLLVLLPLVYPSNVQGQAPDWSYDDPENWAVIAPQCNGSRQSPIALRGTTSLTVPLLPILFTNYMDQLEGDLNFTNNGHSVQFTVPATTNGQRPRISGGILPSTYVAENVHFHWGSPNSKGSEHTIDNIRYDVEMHVVHRNIRYFDVEEASRHRDGLAVLGVMFKIVDEPVRPYPGLYKVLDALPSIRNYASSVAIRGPISLGDMLGDLNTKRFFTYSGSLTTPNCAEAVTWTVFPQPLPIAREEIAKFWDILDANGNPLINNFRPLQNRNRRPVFMRNILNPILQQWI